MCLSDRRLLSILVFSLAITAITRSVVALEPIPEKLVVLTFDDSVKSHYTTVRPILKKYGFGATFFITEDVALDPAAWAHAVDIDGAKPHFHKLATELYYVLEGEGSVTLDGVPHEVHKGSLVHIPPGVVHSACGRMRVLVIGIPDISDADYFVAETGIDSIML